EYYCWLYYRGVHVF
nr:immunoglobulin light chain junction region [Macaca mulatta]